jgi:hypothetical protein
LAPGEERRGQGYGGNDDNAAHIQLAVKILQLHGLSSVLIYRRGARGLFE